MWFVKKKDYDSIVKELENVQNEVVFYRSKFKDTEHKLKEAETRLETLYEQARVSADKMGRLATENKVLAKDSQEYHKLKQNTKNYNEFKKFLNPEPEDPEIRRAYVSQIAGFFNGGLRDYLEYTIAMLKDEIIRFPLQERETDFFRSAVNVCALLIEWGDKMVREHRANATEDTEDTNNVFEADDTAVENIREAIKK